MKFVFSLTLLLAVILFIGHIGIVSDIGLLISLSVGGLFGWLCAVIFIIINY
jgi:hypothetical protein